MDELVAQREQPALVVEADLHRVDLRALLRGRQHVLEAVLEPPYRAAEAHRQQRDQHIFRVHDELGAETAADVGGDHADAVGLEAEQLADELAHLVRHLGGRPHRQQSSHRVVLGDEATRLHRLAAGPADGQCHAGAPRRRIQRRRHVAARERHPAREVVGNVVVHPRRAGRGGLLHRGQRFPGNIDQGSRVLGGIAAVGQHHRDGLADEARAVAGEEVEVLAAQPRVRRHDGQRARGVAEVDVGHHAGDARRLQGALGVDGDDTGVGVGAAHDGRVQHAGERDVPDVAPAALDEARVLLAEEPVADELHRRATPCPGADGRTASAARHRASCACGSS